MTGAVLEAEHLARTFDRGQFQAVADTAEGGAARCMRSWANGAGKTTVVRMCRHVAPLPTSDSVRVDSVDAVAHHAGPGVAWGWCWAVMQASTACQRPPGYLFFADLPGVWPAGTVRARGGRRPGARSVAAQTPRTTRETSALPGACASATAPSPTLLGRPLLLLDKADQQPGRTSPAGAPDGHVAASEVGVLLTSRYRRSRSWRTPSAPSLAQTRIEYAGRWPTTARHAGVLANHADPAGARRKPLDEELRGVLEARHRESPSALAPRTGR